jgi:hypothetical protein
MAAVRLLRLVFGVLCIAACAERSPQASASASAQAIDSASEAHWQATLQSSQGRVWVTELSAIAGPLPTRRDHRQLDWRIEMLGPNGEVLFTTTMSSPRVVHGTFAEPAQGVAVTRDDYAFRVRTPVLPEATALAITDEQGERHTLDLPKVKQ